MLCKVLRANIALRLIFFLTNAIPKSLLPTGPPPSNIKKSDPRNSKYHSYPISTHGFSTSVPLSLNFRINTLKPSQSVKISHQILSHLTSQHHTLSCGEVLRLPCPNLLATLQLSISKLVDYYHFTPPPGGPGGDVFLSPKKGYKASKPSSLDHVSFLRNHYGLRHERKMIINWDS